MKFNPRGDRLYRFLALAGFIVAVALVLAVPDHFKEPDDWAYYYAAENLSQGRLTIDNNLHQQQVAEARQLGGQLIQYVQISDTEWAFEKAPGYIYFLIPFYVVRVPQLANIVLAAGLAIVIYLLLKQLKDEKTACIGAILALFTPVSLAMLQREYMDGFASAAFLGIGGGLYVYYNLRLNSIQSWIAGSVLFLAGLCLAGAVAIRYTDATVVAVIGLHFIVTRVLQFKHSRWRAFCLETAVLGAGAAFPIGLLLWYHNAVFGSPFAYGYEYTKLNVKFAYDYLGDPRAWQIIATNLKKMWVPLLVGFPLLFAAIPAMALSIWQKISAATKPLRRFNKSDWWPELKPDMLLLFLGWFLAVFGLYMMYEWTANQRPEYQPFIIVTRFYLPALLPMVTFGALLLSRIPGRIVIVIMAAAVIWGSIMFAQSSIRELKSGTPQPPNQSQPPGYMPPAELSKLIEKTRLEVRLTPTNDSNLRLRMDVLIKWIGELNRQGYPVGKIMPEAEVKKIQGLILQGKTVQAIAAVDDAYIRMEQFVAVGQGFK
jgi:hypothetical protein